MILQRLTKREKFLFGATLMVLFAALGYGLILEPLVGKWKDLDSYIVQKTYKLDKNLKILQEETRIKEEFQKYAVHTMSMGTDEETTAAFLKVIEQKAGSTSTRITNIRPREVKDMAFYKIFTFEVISESNMGELFKFMYELQNSKELLRVKKLTMTLKSGDPQVLKGIMEITKTAIK